MTVVAFLSLAVLGLSVLLPVPAAQAVCDGFCFRMQVTIGDDATVISGKARDFVVAGASGVVGAGETGAKSPDDRLTTDEGSNAKVLKIAAGEDTINLGEKAVPLGEMREKPEVSKNEPAAGKKSKPGDLFDLKIEKRKPSNIKITIGDEEYGDGKDVVRFGEDIFVAEGDTIDGDAVSIGGSVTVNGTVMGDCVAIGGVITMGPTGVIEGDGVSVGGSIDRAPGSVLKGDEVVTGGHIPEWLLRGGWPKHGITGLRFFGLAFAVGKAIVVIFVAWIILLLARNRVKNTSDKAKSSLLASFGVGLLVIVLTPIAMVLLCITLIGILVAILLPFALIVVGFFGYTAVGLALGDRLFGGKTRTMSIVAAALLGVLIMEAIPIVGKFIGLPGGVWWSLSIPIRIVGYAIMVCAGLIGIGATVMSKFGKPPKPLDQAGVTSPAGPAGPGSAGAAGGVGGVGFTRTPGGAAPTSTPASPPTTPDMLAGGGQ